MNLDKENELFNDNINENLLVQHINVDTQHTLGKTQSRLDLVFTNEKKWWRVSSVWLLCVKAII